MRQAKEIVTKYIAPTWIECAYCAARFTPNDPAQNDHWRTCEKHPARAELEQLRADNDTLRQNIKNLEKNQARLPSRLAEVEAY